MWDWISQSHAEKTETWKATRILSQGEADQPNISPLYTQTCSPVSLLCFIFRTLSQDDKVKKKKKKKAVGTLSVTSMLKKFQREKEKERQKLDKANQKAAALMSAQTIPLCPADAAGGGGSGLTDPLLSLIGSTNDHALIQAANTVDFDIDLDSLLDVSEGTLSPKLVHQPAMEIDYTQVLPPNTNATSQPKPHSDETSLTPPSQCVPLPDGLPPGLADTIRKLAVVRSNFHNLSTYTRGWMDAQMMYANFSGCQNLRGGVETQVLHPRNQLNPARVSYPATQTRLWHNLVLHVYFNMKLKYFTFSVLLMFHNDATNCHHVSTSFSNCLKFTRTNR